MSASLVGSEMCIRDSLPRSCRPVAARCCCLRCCVLGRGAHNRNVHVGEPSARNEGEVQADSA
eukprot:14575682-Alexandrium_andersonii.AAC.1